MTMSRGSLTDATLSYLFILVSDLAGMVRFYRDVLGLRLAYFAEGEFAFFQTGGQGPQLALYPGRLAEVTETPHWFIVLDVPALEPVIELLRSQGVSVGEIEAVPYGRAVQFSDPEGNRFELHEPAA
jgi:predicted enzyme related to lactoylglutathione lyase